MNVKDIRTALLFMVANDLPYVVLQCKTGRDVPYLKRELAHMLGEPRKIIDDSFYYEDKRIMMKPISWNTDGLDRCAIFYVAYRSGEDWNELCANEGIRLPLVPYDLSLCPWLDEGDIYRLLVADGMSGDSALHRMKCDGLI